MAANERTFQGELYRMINDILQGQSEILFRKVTQEENVGTKGNARFADGKLYSSTNVSKVVSFELKDTKWDATDEILVTDAMTKAFNNGFEYFVTGTPRQLVIYKTFKPNTTVNERKLKIYTISSVKDNNAILLPQYEKEIVPKLKIFLKELSDIVHGAKEVHWDSIDKFFVNKLSSYILEASAEMVIPMHEKIKKNSAFRKNLKQYLKSQDIFNLNLDFDYDDVYKICQLSNYFLYLKIIFYSYLQRDVPDLHLSPLEIPDDKKHLNKLLRARFDDVLKHDFELIFEENILDSFEFEDAYIPVLKSNVEQIRTLNFKELNADIIGAIYNTLIDNQEQHNRGQHFTNTNEVDIVNAFCINSKTKFVIDTGCGAGTFLVRAYYFLQNYNKNLTHQHLLERIWGVEIAYFPTFLSIMNLSLLDIKTFDNYPVIIHKDFSKVERSANYTGMFLNVNNTFKVKNLGKKRAEVKLPTFDACIGNPPYIRQELIEDKVIWNNLAKNEHGVKNINQQSDLYVYYLMHTAAFLKEGGRLGYVISSSWLDVSFGKGLQKFILDNFKIIAVIDHQKKRSFETALVNTVILIIEKCSEKHLRNSNNVKFVRVNNDYEMFIGSSDNESRFQKVNDFAARIEHCKSNVSDDDLDIEVINQEDLELSSTLDGVYSNGYWGARFLRSPEIYRKIITSSKECFIPLSKVADVKYGIKSGNNDYFYLVDDTEKATSMNDHDYYMTFGVSKSRHYNFWTKFGWFYSALTNEHFIIERDYVKPILKSQREARNLDVDLENLKYYVLLCNVPKSKLVIQKKSIVKYLNLGESLQHEIHKQPSISGRALWYDLTNIAQLGEFIFPSKIGQRFRLIDNRESEVFCDKVNYMIKLKESYKKYSDIIFLILNSTIFRYFIDLFARQMVVKVSDVDVNLVEKTLIINPSLLSKHKRELTSIYKSLKSREQGTIYEEVLMQDRIRLDQIIFECLGLNNDDVAELHFQACKYVKDREHKSDSLVTSKSKKRLSYDDALVLVVDRFSDIKKYKELLSGKQSRKFKIPDGKAVYPKGGVGSDNLFGDYNIDFILNNTKQSLSFNNSKQIELFKFLYSELDVKNVNIHLPLSETDCATVLKELVDDYSKNIGQVKSLLKLNRSTANHISIYRDLLFTKRG